MSDEMMEDFLIEANELLDEAEDALLELEKGASFKEYYNQMFRAFHTLKGASGMFEIISLQKHMHFLENLLDQKKEQSKLSSLTVDYFITGIEVARTVLTDINTTIDFKYCDPDSEQTEKVEVVKTVTKKPKVKNKGTIWIVDDEQDILDLVELVIEDEDYQTKTFLRAHEVVERLKVEVPGILEKPFKEDDILQMASLHVDRYKNMKLLTHSLDLLIYQFENLKKEPNEKLFEYYKEELKNILQQKNNLYQKVR